MAEIMTLNNGNEIRNYPNFHSEWTQNFNILKNNFDWVTENNTVSVQEPFVHEYFNEQVMRTCIPRRVINYDNDNYGTSHRVHLLDSRVSRIMLSGEYWVEQDDYPSWAENGIFILSKSIWITEDDKPTDSRFDEFEEFYFRCPNNIAQNSYGYTIDDNNDTILLSALVRTNGQVISYRKHQANTAIEDNSFLNNWASVYLAIARRKNKKQFAKNLFASGLI